MKAQSNSVIVSWHWVSNRLYLTVSMMFNRLRTIYQHEAQGRATRRATTLKQAMRKNGSSWASALVAFRQGHREGGSEVRQWPRCPWSLGGPWASRGPWTAGGVWKWHWQISLWNIEDLFLGGSHQNPKKIVAFSSSFLKFTKQEMPIFELTPSLRLALGAPTNN